MKYQIIILVIHQIKINSYYNKKIQLLFILPYLIFGKLPNVYNKINSNLSI